MSARTAASVLGWYARRRRRAIEQAATRSHEIQEDTPRRWMREHGKLGNQNTIPRVTNDRAMAGGLLSVAAAPRRAPLVAVGA